MAAVERAELKPGYDISRILKGGWHLAGDHGDIDRTQAVKDMAAFVEAGVTTFDCADIYTGVEELIGDFRRAYPSLAKVIRVHTKHVPDYDIMETVDAAYTEGIIDRSLQRLGMDCLDMVQYCWWDTDVPRYIDTAMALKDLVMAHKKLVTARAPPHSRPPKCHCAARHGGSTTRYAFPAANVARGRPRAAAGGGGAALSSRW